MNLRILALFLFLAVAALSPAAPAESVYWYEITYNRGDSAEAFAGTSKFGPSVMASCVSGKDLVTLENLRIYGVDGNTPLQWRTARDGQTVFLRPDRILFFYALPGDPAAHAK